MYTGYLALSGTQSNSFAVKVGSHFATWEAILDLIVLEIPNTSTTGGWNKFLPPIKALLKSGCIDNALDCLNVHKLT